MTPRATRATALLWSAAGSPDPRKPRHAAEGLCYWCGIEIAYEACRTRDVCGSSFTDHDVVSVPSSPWVCLACTWTMTGRPPDTLRLWSLVYRENRAAAPSHDKAPDLGRWIHAQNKADPSAFDAILRTPPEGRWVCSIADSGQIHVAPFAIVNRGKGRWCVRFERSDVRGTGLSYRRVADSMQTLYDAGFSKADIAAAPGPSKLYRCGLDLWRHHDEILRPFRGGALFELALFLRRKNG